jgi:hypothetical protein
MELGIAEKYILLLLYAHENKKCKSKLHFEVEIYELSKIFPELKKALEKN